MGEALGATTSSEQEEIAITMAKRLRKLSVFIKNSCMYKEL
jgi:hypothetical protein